MKAANTYPFRNYYLIYTRKSTDDSDNQKNSISYQKCENLKYAKLQGLSIAPVDIENLCRDGVITEKHTGFKENLNWKINQDGSVHYKIERPKFHKLVQLLYRGEYRGVIFLCWDRASRNKSDDSIIDKLLKQGVDIRFAQASYDKTSAGELHMDIDGMFARHYSRVIKEKVTLTINRLREDGICTYRAPIGYLNLGDPRNKPIDPKRAPIIRRLFEKYAYEAISLNDLARWANNQGLTMPPVRRRRTDIEILCDEEVIITPVSRPITFKNLQKILKNPFYTGVIIGNDGKMMKSSSHKALVTDELFRDVQEKLHSRRKSVSYDDRLIYPYRGVFRCESCKRVYTPYEQKTHIYYGSRCDLNCSNFFRSFNIPFIEYKVGEILARLHFTDKLASRLKELERDLESIKTNIAQEIEENERQISKIKEDISYLQVNKLGLLRNSVYSPQDLQREESRLLQKLKSLSSIPEKADPKEVIETALQFSELSKTLHLTFLLGKTPQKEAITSIVFSELNILNKTLQYKGRNGFRVFESPFMSLGDPTMLYSELVKNHNVIRKSIEEIEGFIKNRSPCYQEE